MVITPKMAITTSRVRPTRRRTGRTESISAVVPAPIPVAARSQPRPTAPTPSRFSAIAGSRAMMPPKRTANRSREIAPNTTGCRRMKRSPSRASRMACIPPRVCSRRVLGWGIMIRIGMARANAITAARYGYAGSTTNMKPMATGPAMNPDWNATDLNAITRSRFSDVARSMGRAWPEGEPKERATPNRATRTKIGFTDVGSDEM